MVAAEHDLCHLQGQVRMDSEEEHTGRQMEANTQSGSLKHYSQNVPRYN